MLFSDRGYIASSETRRLFVWRTWGKLLPTLGQPLVQAGFKLGTSWIQIQNSLECFMRLVTFLFSSFSLCWKTYIWNALRHLFPSSGMQVSRGRVAGMRIATRGFLWNELFRPFKAYCIFIPCGVCVCVCVCVCVKRGHN